MVAVKKQVNNNELQNCEWTQPNLTLCFAEKGFGEHQCASGAGDEIRQILPGLQADSEDPASGQG